MSFENIVNPKDLLGYMMNNITYGFIAKNGKRYTDLFSKEWQDNWHEKCLVQTGKSVLKTKIGTCWDQVELERLWFNSHGYKFKTFFMWFEVNRKNDLPTHTFLIYEENNNYYWFEYSFEANRGIHKFNSYEEAIENIKQQQLNYIVFNKLGNKDYLEYLKVYEYDGILSPLGVQEYLDYVTKRNQ